MDDLKKKLQEEISALEYELRNELPKEILKARGTWRFERERRVSCGERAAIMGECAA